MYPKSKLITFKEPFNIASFSSHLDVEHMMDSIITLSSSSSGRSKKDRTKEQPEFKIICKSLQAGLCKQNIVTLFSGRRGS